MRCATSRASRSRRVEQQHFGLIAFVPSLWIISRAEMQRLVVGIDKVAHGFAHDRAEDIVARFEHRLARAEVAAEDDAARLAVLRLIGVLVGAVLFQKDGRVGQTEAVDALLDVADHEQVALVLRKGAENRVLHGVRILILVHRDFGVLRGQRFREGGRRSVRIQQPHREMLQVVEIRRVSRTFRRRQRVLEGVYRVDKGEKRGRGQAAVELGLLRRFGEPFGLAVLNDLFPLLAQLLHHFKELFVLEFAGRAEFRVRNVMRGLDARVPVVPHQRVKQPPRLY